MFTTVQTVILAILQERAIDIYFEIYLITECA